MFIALRYVNLVRSTADCTTVPPQDTSLPAAVFIWTVENNNAYPVDVSITFTFKNGQGDPTQDKAGGVWTEAFQHQRGGRADPVSGVMIHQDFKDMACTYAIAAKQKVSQPLAL